MIIRIPAIGDLHLIAGHRNVDRLAALDRLIDRESALFPAAWVCAGDLSHTGTTIEIRNQLIERFERCAEVAPVIIVPGNHDPSGDLDFLGHLGTRWPIYVVTKPRVIEVEITIHPGKLALACLPYPSKALLVAAGTPHDQLNAASTAAFDAIFMEFGATLAKARARGLLTGAIGHVNIAGSVSSVGQPQIGAELEINPAHLSFLGGCFQVFNHIHKHQRVASAIYPGSICRLDWGETEPKGYVVVTCERAGQDWTHAETFVDLEVPPMYHVEGTLTRDDFTWRVTKGPNGPVDDAHGSPCEACAGTGKTSAASASLFDEAAVDKCAACNGIGTLAFAGADVRVRASYKQSERDVLIGARDRVAALFPGVRRFEFEPIAIADRALRAPEIVQATTIEEKLAAWAKLSGVTWSDRIEFATSELLATDDGDAVVARFAAYVEEVETSK